MLSSVSSLWPAVRDGMLANMPLIWVQYWTALPIFVEDRAMNDGGQLGGRLPAGGHPVDPSNQHRLGDTEGNAPIRTSQNPLTRCLGSLSSRIVLR